ncbi:hypothetical protein EON82_00765 [bacterium]|nr:MAG: hypothetical protein EON82_00765 [bacterium]
MTPRLRLLAVPSLLAVAALALAIYPKLSNTLVGVPTNGATPSGSIRVDQSKLPTSPAQVEVSMRNVAMPDGTPLAVVVDGYFYGYVPVYSRSVQSRLSTYDMTGRGSRVNILLPNGAVIAYTASAWKT